VAASGASGFALGRSSVVPDVVATSPAPVPSGSAAPRTPKATATPATPLVPTPAGREGGRSASYVYTVESNYPVTLTYTDSNGDQISVSSISTPWTLHVDTAEWGTDARPSLIAGSTSTKGDTSVSCTIMDDAGQVIANDTRESAFAGAVCTVFF
jgi:hypothetical protein